LEEQSQQFVEVTAAKKKKLSSFCSEVSSKKKNYQPNYLTIDSGKEYSLFPLNMRGRVCRKVRRTMNCNIGSK
jgi:hypothetical protein